MLAKPKSDVEKHNVTASSGQWRNCNMTDKHELGAIKNVAIHKAFILLTNRPRRAYD